MKKLILSMIFATMFIACSDNSVCPSPEYTQPEQDSTYTQPEQDSTYTQPIQDTTFESIQDTTDTTTYKVWVGHVCTDLNVQSTGSLFDNDARVFVGTWHDKCVFTSSEPESYTEYNYKLDKIVTILTDILLIDNNLVNSIITEVSNSVSFVYIYNTDSGLNFVYIRPIR